MKARLVWLALVVLLGGRSIDAADANPLSPGWAAWEKGQHALLEGHIDQAIASFQESLQQDPGLSRNHLSLAAACLGAGQEQQAVVHLDHYLQAQPDHVVVRGQYAELLLRLNRSEDARAQFERFVADIQDHEALAQKHLVHCHSRLMEIAESEDDSYGLHLHRGIALYRLACQRAQLADPEGELSSEGLLCQAAAELALARMERPGEARPCWYLHQVWDRLAQRQPASRWLRAAEAAAPFSYLTPAEHRDLYLAGRRSLAEAQHK